MTWNLIRLSEAPAAPWRNGGGLTRELAAWPTREDWAWRISVADVTADGPFSCFPDVQRWFAVLCGKGVRLSINGEIHEAVAMGEPLAFDGAARVESRLLAGATRDLNLMLNRQRASGVMTRLTAPRRFTTSASAVVALFGLEASSSIHQSGTTALELPPHTLAWARLPGGSAIEVQTSGALLMQITVC